jgi:anti-sigma factor RsiW
MSCESYEALIALHVEGDLPPPESADVERHLAACPACRSFAAELEESQRALKDLARDDMDAAALAAVRQRVGEALAGAAAPARRPAALWALAAAAGIAVLAFVLQRPGDGPRREPPATSPGPVAVPQAASPNGPGGMPPAVPASHPPRTVAAAPRARARRPAVPPAPRPVAEPTVARNGDPGSPLVIKLVTSDPDIVIYWLVEPNGGKS